MDVSGQPIGSINKGKNSKKDSGTLKMGPIGCTETSMRNYHYSLRNSPEERSSRVLSGGSLKSQMDASDLTQ